MSEEPHKNGKPKKEPVIRRGQKVPYVKSTRKQVEERVEWLVSYYDKNPMASNFEVHKEFRKRWKLHWVTIDQIYIIRAREIIRKRVAMSKDDSKALGLSVIFGALKSPDLRIRIKAEERLAKIQGYEAPHRQEISGPEGGPIATKEENPLAGLSTDDLRKLAESRNGNGNGN